MRQRRFLPTALVTAVLLPGLVLAAPIAGPCGRCGDGDACHLQRPVHPTEEPHACCDTGRSEESPEPALGSSSCECGRDAPQATLGDAPSVFDGSMLESPLHATAAVVAATSAIAVNGVRPPAPPPSPPAFLVDCAFLT